MLFRSGRLIPVRDRTSSPRPAALPSDAALEAMTGTQLRKLMARRGVGRGPQDRKEDFIDKLKARAAGETYVNKPNPYKRRAPTRRKLPAKSGGLCLGSRVLAFGKRGTITDLPGMNGWWRVRLDGDSLKRSVRAGDMRALGGAVAPPPPNDAETPSDDRARRQAIVFDHNWLGSCRLETLAKTCQTSSAI